MDTKILSRLQRLCVKKECCRSEIYAKALKALEGDVAAAEEMTESLVKDRFVDDFRYAAAFAREKSALTGWGPVKIRFALRSKKISADAIAQALTEIDSSTSSEKLKRLVEAKRKTLEGDPQIRLKLIRFALSRGYEYDEVEKILQ